MRMSVGLAAALAVLLSPAAPSDVPIPEAVADHDQHPGLGHPEGGEGHHEHGDADDHHESPDSPCHHHDTHTCCSQGAGPALAGDAPGVDSRVVSRIVLPSLFVHARISLVEFLHVPLA